MDLTRMTAAELGAAIASGETSSVEVTQAHLDRIAAVDDRVHAFLHVDADGALAQAKRVDAGELTGPLAGVPLALKDVAQEERDRRVVVGDQDVGGRDRTWGHGAGPRGQRIRAGFDPGALPPRQSAALAAVFGVESMAAEHEFVVSLAVLGLLADASPALCLVRRGRT